MRTTAADSRMILNCGSARPSVIFASLMAALLICISVFWVTQGGDYGFEFALTAGLLVLATLDLPLRLVTPYSQDELDQLLETVSQDIRSRILTKGPSVLPEGGTLIVCLGRANPLWQPRITASICDHSTGIIEDVAHIAKASLRSHASLTKLAAASLSLSCNRHRCPLSPPSMHERFAAFHAFPPSTKENS